MTVSAPGLVQPAAGGTVRSEVRRTPFSGLVRRQPRLVIGGGLVAVLVLVGVFAPLLTPYNPIVGDVSDALQPPSGSHWLGTDDLGRDILTRVMFGARVSLRVALISVGIG